MNKSLIAVTISLSLVTSTVVASVAGAAVKPKHYNNCQTLNAAYKHGVGRPSARDKTSTGHPVTNFTKSAQVYNLNTARDRDKDGIACEKR